MTYATSVKRVTGECQDCSEKWHALYRLPSDTIGTWRRVSYRGRPTEFPDQRAAELSALRIVLLYANREELIREPEESKELIPVDTYMRLHPCP